MLLRHLLDEGLSKTAIARRLGGSRRVIYHWIRTGQVERDPEIPPPPRRAAPRPTKLAEFVPIIQARLDVYPELTAVRLLAECRSAGYTGGITQLRDHVARVRPRAEPEPIVRFEAEPGRQAQVDLAEVRLPWGKRDAFIVVLGYSRLPWFRPSLRGRLRAQFADLRMPGALKALDSVLASVDGGHASAAEAIEQLLGAQITLRNSRVQTLGVALR